MIQLRHTLKRNAGYYVSVESAHDDGIKIIIEGQLERVQQCTIEK